jgi:phage terminase Nu1 subunit (DNA packaging protein)
MTTGRAYVCGKLPLNPSPVSRKRHGFVNYHLYHIVSWKAQKNNKARNEKLKNRAEHWKKIKVFNFISGARLLKFKCTLND